MNRELLLTALIIAMLVIARHVFLYSIPNYVPAYLSMAVVSYALSLYVSRSNVVATFVTLLVTLARIIYRYNTDPETLKDLLGLKNTSMFIIALILVVIVSKILAGYTTSVVVHWGVYVMAAYIIISLIEWIVHKYLMHCYVNMRWLEKVSTSNIFLGKLSDNCKNHKNHHLGTRSDMLLATLDDKYEIVIGWSSMFLLAIVFMCIMFPIIYLLELKINRVQLVATAFLFSVVYVVAWNSLHARIHSVQFKQSFGTPPSIGLHVSHTGMYYRNHEMHHRIKGKNKGNFNAVALGADEIFGSNRLVR
jgi:hypothetical protein